MEVYECIILLTSRNCSTNSKKRLQLLKQSLNTDSMATPLLTEVTKSFQCHFHLQTIPPSFSIQRKNQMLQHKYDHYTLGVKCPRTILNGSPSHLLKTKSWSKIRTILSWDPMQYPVALPIKIQPSYLSCRGRYRSFRSRVSASGA